MSWPTLETVQLERDGAVTWLRLNRPDRLNALTAQGFEELAEALRAIEVDSETRVVVMTGNGRGFCSGSDVAGLKERLGRSAEQQRERLERIGRDVVLRLHGLAVPTIAAINGAAAGGGLSLALACDIRIASDQATMSFGFTEIGLIPDLGATYFLPATIGTSRACHLLWTNARLTAADAIAIGLVDSVAPAAEFTARVASLASQVASAPQLAVRLGRQALRRAGDRGLEAALEAEALAQSLCLTSSDHREGVHAFLKRADSRTNREGGLDGARSSADLRGSRTRSSNG